MTTSSMETAVPGVSNHVAARSRTGARRLVLFGALGLVVVAGVIGLTRSGNWLGGAAQPSGLLTSEVQPIDMDITVLGSGTLESASSVNVLSNVEGQIAIIDLVAEGSRVNQGDVVVELDSAALKTRATEQQIIVERTRASAGQAAQQSAVARSQAESDTKSAELAVEFSQLDLRKYEEGDFPQELRVLETDILLAEEELERAKVQVQFSEKLRRDGFISETELNADRSRANRAQVNVDLARRREGVLREFAFPRTKRDLESKVAEARRALERATSLAKAAVEQAETSLKAQESTLRLEESKLTHITAQIERCSMRAPHDGIVVYPVPTDTDLVELFIKAGTIVRERQHIFSIPSTDVLQISTAVHEAVVNQVKPGLQTRIWIDVYPDLELGGEVTRVAPLPQPEDWRRATVKFYETTVKILDPAPGLRPGMSAKVEILVDHLSNVLGVPVQAVVQRGRSGFCYVLEGRRPVLRRLTLGRSNEHHVEVVDGLQAAERIVLSPDAVGISDELLRTVPEKSAPVLAAPGPSVPRSATEPGPRPASPVVKDNATDQAPQPAQAEAPAPEPEIVTKIEYPSVLTGTAGASGETEYQIETIGATTLLKFSVDVVSGTPGAVWDVTVDGELIGQVTLDEYGACAVSWKSKNNEFPANFPPSAGPGSVVKVGPDLQGTMTR